MGNKVKVLQIDNAVNQDNASRRVKKTFAPIQQPWYNEASTTNIGMGQIQQTQDVSQTKISLIQNANSHFLKNDQQFSFDINANDVNNTQFESISVLENDGDKTQLPEEIVRLRKESYAKEQAQRKETLARVNLKGDCDFHLENHNLLTVSSQLAQQQLQNQNDFDLQQYEIVDDLQSETEIMEEDLMKENFNNKTLNGDLEQIDFSDQTTDPYIDDDGDELLDSIEAGLSEVTKNLKSSPTRKNITLTPHQLDESILDYTVSGKIDDMDREIARRTKEKNSKRAKNDGDMTMMLNNIISSADKNKKINQKANEELPAWINDADELARIKELPKKEQKKLLKKMKRKK